MTTKRGSKVEVGDTVINEHRSHISNLPAGARATVARIEVGRASTLYFYDEQDELIFFVSKTTVLKVA
jgi:hypothetical protein